MALSYSHVVSWVDKGRNGLRCGYTDVTFDGSPTAGAWSADPDNFSQGITLFYVNSGFGPDGEHIHYDVTNEQFEAYTAAGVAATTSLNTDVVRFYWEGY